MQPHPHFERHGSDIHLDLPVSLSEAVLGASIPVPTVEGKVTMKIPPGSNSGSTLRLKGKGMPARRGGQRGDQYVKLKVMLPEKPDSELKDFISEWSKKHSYNPRAKAGLV
ncbi:DnaJ C-terminal domain-containing protein [Fodinicurvata halophila]|uniref:DnaJ C-terminal domain-containing protein n=1 Tax=Fodinicurvata halophila TaxID=1419723 RepID=UPI00363830D7